MNKKPMGYVPGKGNPLDKKPPPSKKYSNVKSKLEGKTGFTVKDVRLMSDQHVAKRKGELFGRIKPATLAGLLTIEPNSESIYQLGGQGEEEKQMPPYNQQQNFNDDQSYYSFVTAQTNVTQVSQITNANQQGGISEDTTFLLLDLREPDDFDKFTIKDSISYPAPNISRDKLIPQLFKFKNQENKMIIVYHLDERNGTPFAQLLAQKGYENIYLLTGGVESFMQEFPEYMEGNQIPNIPKLQPGDKKKKLVKRQNHKQYPEEQEKKIKDDSKGERVAKQIIHNNNQSTTLSQANQSDIQSITSGIKNVTLTQQNLERLG